jgi:tRNA(Ile)-lysidine synthase
MRPLGMTGHRKLQDLFVDRKLPADRRWTSPVLESAGEIVWVPGLARSAHALVTAKTRSACRITAKPSEYLQDTGIAAL